VALDLIPPDDNLQFRLVMLQKDTGIIALKFAHEWDQEAIYKWDFGDFLEAKDFFHKELGLAPEQWTEIPDEIALAADTDKNNPRVFEAYPKDYPKEYPEYPEGYRKAYRLVIEERSYGVYIYLFTDEDDTVPYDYHYEELNQLKRLCFSMYGVQPEDWKEVPCGGPDGLDSVETQPPPSHKPG